MKPLKLRNKLTLFYAAVITVLLAAAGALFYSLMAYQMNRDLRDELSERAAGLRGYLRFEGRQPTLVYDADDPEEAFFVGNATRYYQVYDSATGEMVARSPQLQALGFQYTPQELKELVAGPEFTSLETEQVELLLHNDLVHSADGHAYLVQIGIPLEGQKNSLRRLLRTILLLIPCGVALALLSGWWVSGRMLRPLAALSWAAKDIGISQLHRRLPVAGTGDELDRLATTFNDMFARLERAVAQMREFTASISHELRTPLTALRGEAEVTLVKARTESDYRRVLESQLEEFGKLSRMIDQMLTLARAEGGQIPLGREKVNLSELVQSLVDQMEPVAAAKSIILKAATGQDILTLGDPGWLERAILNLLDNAIKYTGERGRVDVLVNATPQEAVLEVRDNGIGISAEALPHVFERFYRADPSRSKETDGAGLGLSLVDWIIQQHQGRITVESRPEQGTVFRIALPLAI